MVKDGQGTFSIRNRAKWWYGFGRGTVRFTVGSMGWQQEKKAEKFWASLGC